MRTSGLPDSPQAGSELLTCAVALGASMGRARAAQVPLGPAGGRRAPGTKREGRATSPHLVKCESFSLRQFQLPLVKLLHLNMQRCASLELLRAESCGVNCSRPRGRPKQLRLHSSASAKRSPGLQHDNTLVQYNCMEITYLLPIWVQKMLECFHNSKLHLKNIL